MAIDDACMPTLQNAGTAPIEEPLKKGKAKELKRVRDLVLFSSLYLS
jgi:hypothetical protein